MDVLADILSTTELRSELYFRACFRQPFAVAVPEDRQHIRFHVAGPGRSWIALASGEGVWVEEGDLVLVPRGAAHVIADSPETPALPLPDVLEVARETPAAGLEYGGAGDPAVLVCGHFAYDESLTHPILMSLPPLVHLRRAEGRNFAWLDATLDHIQQELRAGRPGFRAVVRRLCEVIFVEVLRAFMETSHSSAATGALAALGDPQLGRALTALHGDPARDWSLDELATAAGLSRTLFTERFRAKLEMSPMQYLAQWRMQKARKLLEQEDLSVGDVARAVGYASEAAFNRGFKRHFGEPPGRLRRNAETPE